MPFAVWFRLVEVGKISMQKIAILIRGDRWQDSSKQLPHVEKEMQQLDRWLREQQVVICGPLARRDEFVAAVRERMETSKDLRLIHYSGHFDHNALEISENEFINATTLQANHLQFPAKPLVFLNGCASARLENLWEKSRNLSTAFLACGAGACVVSLLAMENQAARFFTQKFYGHFLLRRRTAGESLRQARLEMASRELFPGYDPNYDVTRYFYHLYGDPALRF